MTIILDNMPSKFRASSAKQTQSVLVAQGIDASRFVIGADYNSNENYEAGMYSDKDYHNHYWLRKNKDYIEFLDQFPSTDYSSLAIPFFLSDFAIDQAMLLDKSISLETVRRNIQQRYPKAYLATTREETNTLPLGEGYFVEVHDDWILLFYTERGKHDLLAKTQFPWVVGLVIAWRQNYRNIDWASFNPRE